VRWRIGRAFLALWLVATVVLPWMSGFVPPLAAAWVVAIAVAMSIATWRIGAGARAVLAASSALCVLVTLAAASMLAANKSARILAAHFPDAATHDLVLSPLPANPLCWGLLAIQTEREAFVERRALVSLAPGVIAADRCSRDRPGTTAPLAAVPAASTAEIDYRGQFSAPLAELSGLARDNCVVAGLLRFARAPFWLRRGERLVAGDLRYDRDPALDFAELETARSPERCPRHVPSWIPPRQDVLGRANAP
jgi:inner membrane protein